MDNGAFAKIPIFAYQKSKNGLKEITIMDIHFGAEQYKLTEINMKNCAWLSTFMFDLDNKASWNGYMANEVSGYFETTSVIPLPMINLDPGNLTTLHSALIFAKKMAVEHSQDLCSVTFDQPLFLKATDIVESAPADSPLKRIFVRLGGFHLLMSFLGSIGYIMSNSGLEDMWETVFARNSISSMLTGHSYASSLRAHFISHLAQYP